MAHEQRRARTNFTDSGPTARETISWDELILNAAKTRYNNGLRLLGSYYTNKDKSKFVSDLFGDARFISEEQPQEISQNLVDVNEKEYSNLTSSADENACGADCSCRKRNGDGTCVKIISIEGSTQGHNYLVSTTKGVQWGGSANIGMLFGLPQASAIGGPSIAPKLGVNFTRMQQRTESTTTKNNTAVGLESHHVEKVTIPPGKKVVVRMTSYRVKYKNEYTVEYKIPKGASVRIFFDPCGNLGLISRHGRLTASEIMRTLPGFREDDEYAYFTGEGELRWIADRVVVEKTVSAPL